MTTTNTATSPLLKPDQVAEMLGVSKGHLANQRHRREGIRYFKLGGSSVRYRLDDVLAYIAASAVEPVGAA